MIGRALIGGARAYRDASLAQPAEWLIDALAASRSLAGPRVDERSALGLSAVAACVGVVSEDIGKVPCIIYERTTDGRVRVPEDTYAPALGLSPNPEMSAMEYWENMTGYLMLWGHAEAWLNKRSDGSIELWPLPPNRTEQVREKLADGSPGQIIGINVTLDNGEKRFLANNEIVTVRRRGYDNKSPIQRHRETIGLGLAAEEFGSRFFSQGGHAGGFISLGEDATNAEADRAEAKFRSRHEGLSRAHVMGVLTGGATWQDVGMPLKDAQYIDGRKFSVEEICRIFRVPPHKVASLDRATFSNIEHQSIEYVSDSLMPYSVRLELAHRVKLYPTKNFGRIGERYPEFLLDALLRGDTKTRFEAYTLAITNGWMNRNEVRARENLSRVDELDKYLVPLNMQVVGEPVDPQDESIRKLAALMSRNGNHADDDGLSEITSTVSS